MKSRILLNLFLFVMVAGLGLFAYFQPKNVPQADHALSVLAANSILHIKIEKPGQPSIELEKKADKWIMTSPFRARADDLKISALTGILGAHSQQRFDTAHLERYELDQPLLTLTLNNQSFMFGTINPLDQAQQYINTENAVYMIPTRYFASALTQATDFSSKKFLADSEVPSGFDFPGHSFNRENGNWVSLPDNNKFSQDQLNSFAEEWRMASALISQPYDHSRPLSEFTIQLTNHTSLLIKVLRKQPELVLLRTDENLQYHFPPALATRLLQPN